MLFCARPAVGSSSWHCLVYCSTDQPGGGQIPKVQLQRRIDAFSRGDWASLLASEQESSSRAAQGFSRRRRRVVHDDVEARAARAEALVQLGELSVDNLLHSPTGWAQLSTPQNCAHILARGALRRYQQLSPLDMVQLRVSAPHSVRRGLASGEMISALGCSLHPTCDRVNRTWPLIVLCDLSLDHGTRNCRTPDWRWVELGNHRNGNWLQTVCSLRHEAGQPRNLCGIPLLELGLDVHLTIVHPERNDLDDSELGHMN